MKAMDLADYVIIKANELNKPVQNLKLQKVMYFLNAYYMFNHKGKALIEDKSFERWDYGPTIRSVYYEYSSYGSSEINIPFQHIKLESGEDNKLDIKLYNLDVTKINQSVRNFIDENIGKLLKFDAFELVKESQQEPQWEKLSNNEEYSNRETLKYYTINKFIWQ